MNKVIHKRSSVITDGKPKLPSSDVLDYGELAINYADGMEVITMKNTSNEIIEFRSKEYVDNEINDVENGYKSADDILKVELQGEIDASVQKLMTNTNLSFFCIEPVSITINEETTEYSANSLVNVMLKDTDVFTITTTSDSSIQALYAWPKALDYFYPWLEGVSLFNGILFDMNSEDMYTKWNQGNQGIYHVQYAQYKNCVFWSDLGYISDVAKRTNYTLYNSSELPLCYSTIPDNTFKAFYFAYNVTSDPNWSNQAYKDSFAKATWATQVFSYYGLHSIGMFDVDSTRFNITLPKDCRGLMFSAPNILNAGVFDAINVTNFGSKQGSWRDAFAYCYQLQNLYIKNLKVGINISWSPISQQSLAFILENAANTTNIVIYLSEYTYYRLTDANKTTASEKNITLSLIATNTTDDNRLRMLQTTGDGNSYLASDGTYKAITIPDVNLGDYYTKQEIDNKGYLTQHQDISGKQDVISDLATIRANASLGATALQSVPSEYVTEMELANKNYATSSYVIGELAKKTDTGHTHPEYLTEHQDISGKQDVISDLDTIRSNAAKGATALQSVPSEYITESELTAKGYLTSVPSEYITETELNGKGYLTKEELSNVATSGSYNDLTDKPVIPSIDGLASEAFVREEIEAIDYVTAVDTVEEVDGVSNDFVTSEQLDGRDYATNSSVNSQINTVNDSINGVKTRLTKVENLTSLDMRASVLWLGTSIPSGDINIDPQQINTYPRMVADALGFDLYNMAKAGSFVAWYPQAPAWTTSDQVAAEFATAYSLSATRQEIYDKYYSVLETIRQNEGLSTTWRDDYLNDFMDSSFETRIIPYIDGTIAKCDGVVIDHGFNDRGNIFNVCNQHVTADKDSISVWGPGSGADGVEYPVIGGNAGWWWLTHLADNRYYDGEVYMNTVYAVANGLAGNDTGGMRGEYFGAMAYIIAKIQQVDPRIRIVIGNYFSQDYGSALGDGMNSFQTKYILQANQSIADYYGFPCVNVYKHTGLRNRTIRKPDGTTISDMYWFCPDGVHPSSDTTGLSNTIVASAYIAQIKGCFFKLG